MCVKISHLLVVDSDCNLIAYVESLLRPSDGPHINWSTLTVALSDTCVDCLSYRTVYSVDVAIIRHPRRTKSLWMTRNDKSLMQNVSLLFDSTLVLLGDGEWLRFGDVNSDCRVSLATGTVGLASTAFVNHHSSLRQHSTSNLFCRTFLVCAWAAFVLWKIASCHMVRRRYRRMR